MSKISLNLQTRNSHASPSVGQPLASHATASLRAYEFLHNPEKLAIEDDANTREARVLSENIR